CIRIKFTGRVSGGFPGDLLPVLSRRRRKRPQRVSDDADNGFYGKWLVMRHSADDFCVNFSLYV
ncbi:hypothetical protein QIG66_28045, partial [Klebsiella pneumoniae]|nr:hypothetical protein [Klebsiella pneumoniae]